MNVVLLLVVASVGQSSDVVVGSKAFSESDILAQVVVHLAANEGLVAEHQELAGTKLVWDALVAGDVSIYPEYTGTIRQEIFAGHSLPDQEAMRAKLAEVGILMTKPLGFNNSYAVGLKSETLERLGIEKISDLKQHANLRFALSSEFMDRADGWPSLKARYSLPQTEVRGMEHGLAYRAIDAGEFDATDIYTTDATPAVYDIVAIEDDLGHFPRYDAVFLYRQDLGTKHPGLIAAIKQLEGGINDQQMTELNGRVQLDHVPSTRVAAEFLNERLGLNLDVRETSRTARILETTIDHLFLVTVSLFTAIVISVPLGVVTAKNRVAGQLILGFAEIVQTIPGLALFVLLAAFFVTVGLPMTGALPVIVAVFLYSLLPIIRNTAAGITSVPGPLMESATALGLSPVARLWKIELPLASPMVLAGIKTTAVISVGYAALGGLIGTGGYGQPIMTGLRLNRFDLTLEGAIPAAVMAIVVKLAFELLEAQIVPRGLRIKSN